MHHGTLTCGHRKVIYKSAKAQIFPHYESAKKLLHKRNSDRYRNQQQRFTKPQTGLYTIRAMYSISQHQRSGLCSTVTAGQCENAGQV